MGKLLLWTIFILVGAGTIAALVGNAGRGTPPATSTPVASRETSTNTPDPECAAQWDEATAAGIVFGVGMIGGELAVEVDPATWKSVPFDTKVGMVAVLNCASFGKTDKQYRVVNFISRNSHNRVGRWENGRLTVIE